MRIKSIVIIAALSLAAGLVGCAEDGDSGAEIGVTSEGIMNTDVAASGPALTIDMVNYPLAYHSSCVINSEADGTGTNYLLVAGGEPTSTPTYSSDAFLLKVSGGPTWYRFAGVLQTAVSHGVMVQKPGDASKCLFFGGEGAMGTYNTTVRELSLTFSGMPAVPVIGNAAASGNMTGRSRLQVAKCGTDKLLIAGGTNGTASKKLEVWSAGAVTTFKETMANGGSDVELNNARSEFAMAESDTSHIIVAGGLGTGGRLDTIEQITVTANCELDFDAGAGNPVNVKYLSGGGMGSITLNTARKGVVGFYFANVSGTQDKFVIAAGETSAPAASNLHDELLIDWNTPANNTRTNPTTVSTAVYYPTLLFTGTAHAYLFGGVGENDFQEYSAGWTATSTRTDSSTLLVREGAIAELVGGTIYVNGGHDAATPTKGTTHTTESVTP
jgi:hypothetical protein